MGYFIDFYDLTIMGVSYSELIQEQFHITDISKIQQTYLSISNFQTLGIFIGAILFGVLGDKMGRAKAIRYSILLYSLANLAAIFTHSLSLFIALRMLAYIGLASEFATSTVLIIELFPVKSAAWATAILYSFGVLGGILATTIGMFSWKIMFAFGGTVGVLLFLGRRKIQESEAYLYARKENKQALFGSFKALLSNKKYIIKIIQYFLMTTPYFALITLMFIFPNYIIKNYTLSYAIQLLTLGFFCGNIISCLLSALLVQYNCHYKHFMFMCLCIYLVLMPIFPTIPESYMLIYGIGLGLIGGGYIIALTQQAGRDFPIHIRSLACNTLFAMGRGSSIVFNLLISSWLIVPDQFIWKALLTVAVVFFLAAIALFANKSIKTLDNK